MAQGSSVRKEMREKRKKRSSSYNKTPDMPEEKGEDSFTRGKLFLPGIKNRWSAPVGKRRTRVIESEEKNRTMSDNYRSGTRRLLPEESDDVRGVKGYKDGGAVCQGGGKAIAGTKFRGVR